MAIADRWIADPRSGGRLVVPADQIEALQKAALERRDETRRRFMADKGENKDEGKQAYNTEIAIDQPMHGDVLSWASSYAPWESIGGRRKPTDTVPFGFLRQVARQSFLDRVIIDKRISQMKHFARFVDYPGDKQPGFRVVHRRHGDPTFVETPDIASRCAEVQARLANTTPEIHNGFRDLVTSLVEDELVLDRKVCVIYRDMMGRPAQWHAIDGSTVKPRLQVLLPWMYENRTDNQALAAEIMSSDKKMNPKGIDLTNAAYVQEVEGRFVAAWTSEQMTIDVTNPSTRVNSFGYGTSLLEKSLEGTRAWVMAWNYNAEMFKTNYPEAILALLGDYDPVGLESFKRQVLGEVGEFRNWRLSVVPGGPPDQFKAELIKLRDTPKDMLFGELLRMLIALKCAAYTMHPSEINFAADMGAQETIFAKGSTEKEVSRQTEEGMHTMIDNWCDWITRAFVQQNYDDLKLIVEGLDRPSDDQLVQMADMASKSALLIDEVRARYYNMPPLENGMGEYIDSPSFLQQQTMVMQAEAAEQQEGAYEEGDFGEDGEGGGDDQSPFGGKGKDDKGKGKGGSPFGGKGKDEQDSGSAEGSDSADAPGGQWDEETPTGSVERPKAKPKDKKKSAKPGQHHPEGAPADKEKYTNKEAHGKPSEHHVRTKEGPPSKKRGEEDAEHELGDRGADAKSEKKKGRPDREEGRESSGDRREGPSSRSEGKSSKSGDRGREGDRRDKEDDRDDRDDRGGRSARSRKGDKSGDDRVLSRGDRGSDEGSEGDGLDAIVELLRDKPDLLKQIVAALGEDEDDEPRKN